MYSIPPQYLQYPCASEKLGKPRGELSSRCAWSEAWPVARPRDPVSPYGVVIQPSVLSVAINLSRQEPGVRSWDRSGKNESIVHIDILFDSIGFRLTVTSIASTRID